MVQGPTTRETPWPVSMLSSKLKEYLDRLGTVWIEGEVTQWGVSAGNVYGKLKDLEAEATVSFTIWSSTRAKLGEHRVVGVGCPGAAQLVGRCRIERGIRRIESP